MVKGPLQGLLRNRRWNFLDNLKARSPRSYGLGYINGIGKLLIITFEILKYLVTRGERYQIATVGPAILKGAL